MHLEFKREYNVFNWNEACNILCVEDVAFFTLKAQLTELSTDGNFTFTFLRLIKFYLNFEENRIFKIAYFDENSPEKEIF